MTSAQSDLLKDLTPDEAKQVLGLGSPLALPAGAVLFQLGDHADRLFVVEQGRITLTLPMQIRGQEKDVPIEERLPGDTVGWSGLIPPHRFTLKATATVDSRLVAFPREALLKHFAAHPDVAYKVTRNVGSVIGHRLEVFQTMWLREMQRTVEQRYS